jgi:hypothetical protein
VQRRMKPLVTGVSQHCPDGALALAQIDIASMRALAADESAVRDVPTFLFLDETGREVARLVGEQPREPLEANLAAISGGRCNTTPSGG